MIISFLSLYFLLLPGQGFTLDPDTLKKEIKKNRQTLCNEKQIIKKLSKKEKNIYAQLARIEARVQKITQELNLQEEELSTIKTNEALIVKKYQHLISEQKKTRKQLTQILSTLWPIFLQNKSPNFYQLQNRAEADRYIVWLKSLYSQAQNTFARLKLQSRETSVSLVKLQELKEKTLQQLKKINATKDNCSRKN